MWRKTHPNFKLNGVHYSVDELLETGYSLIKEGEPFEKPIGDFLVEWGMASPELVVHTSGSTGEPKAITLQKEHMVQSALATGLFFGLQAGHSALLCLACTGIAGKMMLVRAMVLGLELDYAEPSSTPLAGTQRNYDFAAMVPLQVEKSLSQISQINTLIIGGAPVSSGLREKLQAVSTQCYETYGMTETITHVAVKAIQNSKFKIENSENPIVEQSNNRAIQQSNFTALPNITFSQDKRDCLVIDAPKISHEQVITNDVVKLISETEFHWLGRYDSIINSGGIKLIPEQIERKLDPMISNRFFVIGMPDEALGQKLVLVIEGDKQDTEELFQQIKSLEDMGKYETPKEIRFIKTFTETPTGKVDKSKTMDNLQ
nr:AMP-binding protein [Allomuricauda sp.]